MNAYTRLERAGEMAMQIFPTRPVGIPGLRVMSVQVSPPSVLLNSPVVGPPLSSSHGYVTWWFRAAMITFGFVESMARSTAPVVSPLYRIRSQVLPPSVVR